MEEEAKKKFLMKVWISSLMILILVFWFLNMKNVFHDNEATADVQSAQQTQKMRQDLNDTIDKMTKRLDSLEASSTSAISPVASSSPLITSSTPLLATTSSTTASSTTANVKKTSCPAYIDCMPTIGQAHACQIPVGCEGITQIAY
jgi:cytoskeletal protein RodZ